MTPPVLRLHGEPCTVCGQPAHEVVMYADVHVITHSTLPHRQRPCRVPAPPPSATPLPQPPARPRPARYHSPTGRPITDVHLPGDAS